MAQSQSLFMTIVMSPPSPLSANHISPASLEPASSTTVATFSQLAPVS